ncbi:multi-sensor hybrid histidine kinase [Desulfarculus baarsii DSM 2075]|uniref:histidine kinase n=1 Tax=Desulfarculus baarsii (strain ATCC 33931 / DSM 2075 / LMG 7858 / VKM B-1802 / 2st14) TaxID=644282 RepID=E1QJ75_DESB2|nr:ATP-binding protein [Desulfarculus baarsii]ADK85618.1 multi-sensor hybrid histidine kinase [Desulfarculus baarsii DSM 2075]
MLKKMKLAPRLGLAFGVMLALLVGLGLFALSQMDALSRLNADLYEHPFAVKGAALAVDASIVKINNHINVMSDSGDANAISAELAKAADLQRQVKEHFRIIHERFLGHPSLRLRAEERFTRLMAVAREVAALAGAGDLEAAQAKAKGEGVAATMEAVAAMGRVRAFAEGKAAEFFAASERASAQAMVAVWLAMAVALLTGLALTMLFARSIVLPAKEIAAAAEAVAGGDLSRRIGYHGDDEIGQMAESLRRMLAGVIGEGQSIKNGFTVPFWTADKNLALTFMNQAAAAIASDITGLGPERIVGRLTVSEALADEAGMVAVLAADCLASGQKQQAEVSFNHAGARTILHLTTSRLLDQNGLVIGVMGVGVDITARRQAEVALRQREALLNDVGALARIGGWEVDTVSGQGKWTAATYDICEYDPGQPSPPVDEFVESYLPEYRAGIASKIKNLMELDQPLLFEAQFVTAKGNLKWARVQGRAEREGGRCTRIFGAFQDITEQKRAGEERKLLEAQLRQSQKMEAIGTLAGGVAHDFNNILSAIIGYVELALLDSAGDEALRGNLEQVLKSSWRARDLVAQLLAYSRKQLLSMSTFGLDEVVGRNEAMLRRIVGEDIDLEVNLSPFTGVVRADVSQLEQVLLNLVANARDAMPTGGKITLETDNVHLDENYAARHAEATVGPHVMLAVSDNGPGMDSQTQERIFDPFFTTKGAGKGTGLGLAMVYGIVKQHGGSIYVYSEPGQGSTFKIYLPRVTAPSGDLAEPALLAQPVGGHETILLVEDDDVVRDFSGRMLERLGYVVLAAADGDDALRLAAATERVDLLLTDVIMPRMSGKELARRLSAQRPEIKVLYISGYTDNVIAHHGVLDAGVAFLQKPAALHALAAKVRQVLDA